MQTREIPDGEWVAFFEAFSRIHHGQRASVSTVAMDLGVQPNARDLPLMGVSAEGTPGGARQVEIMLGESPEAHLVHTVVRPSRVSVAEWNDAYSAAVRIESADGWTTLLRVGPEAEVLEPGVVMDDINPPPQ